MCWESWWWSSPAWGLLIKAGSDQLGLVGTESCLAKASKASYSPLPPSSWWQCNSAQPSHSAQANAAQQKSAASSSHSSVKWSCQQKYPQNHDFLLSFTLVSAESGSSEKHWRDTWGAVIFQSCDLEKPPVGLSSECLLLLWTATFLVCYVEGWWSNPKDNTAFTI